MTEPEFREVVAKLSDAQIVLLLVAAALTGVGMASIVAIVMGFAPILVSP